MENGIQIFLSSFRDKSLIKFKDYDHFKDSELNILLSFGTRETDYTDMLIDHRELFNEVIFDSGAFTINNSGGASNFSGFKSFFKIIPCNLFKFVITYDADFSLKGFEANNENLIELEEAGIKTVPVIHDYTGMYFDEIEFYLNAGYPLIALGKADDKKKSMAQAVKRIINSGRKVHLLGGTEYDRLKNLPVHYCDSSNWTAATTYGYVYFWNEHNADKDLLKDDMTDIIRFWDKEDQIRKNHGYYVNEYPWRIEFEKYIKDMFGFTIRDLYGHDRFWKRELINIHYFIVLQDKLRQYHKRNNIFPAHNNFA